MSLAGPTCTLERRYLESLINREHSGAKGMQESGEDGEILFTFSVDR